MLSVSRPLGNAFVKNGGLTAGETVNDLMLLAGDL